MKKKLLSLLLLGGLTLTAGAQYQLPNPGFEGDWETVTGNYNKSETEKEPLNWNSFVSCSGYNGGSLSFLVNPIKVAQKAGHLFESTDVRPNASSKSKKCALLKSRNTGYLGIYAQGNLTTGRVFAGSGTAADATKGKGNYNYTDTSADGYFQIFKGKPDSMRVWIKYTSGTGSSSYAKAKATIHKNGYYQDPESYNGNSYIDNGVVIARAEKVDIASCDWTSYSIKFDYEDQSNSPEYILVSFSTNATPGESKKGEEMYIDDVEFIYNSGLSDLKYNGITIDGFNKDTYEYSVDGIYTPGCLSFTKNCAGGEVVLGVYDEANQSITVTVKGDDISVNPSNYHTYTINFVEQSAPEIVSSTDYSDNLVVVINGENTLPQETTINVSKMSDGSYTLSLNDFMLVAGEDILPVGNIVLEGLTATEENETISFSTNQSILIQPGSTGSAEDWFGPMLGEVPIVMTAKVSGGKMKCEIDIDMTVMLGQVINVYFGVVNNLETEALPDAEGVHVVLNRTFQPGWSTLYLQYDVTKEELGAVKVMELDIYDEESQALVFREVVGNNIGGNYPYLVKFDSEKANPFFANRVVWNSHDSRTCGSWVFTGTFTGIAAPGMEGKYGVTVAADGYQYIRRGGKNASIKGTRAFFEYYGEDQGVQQMRIRIEGEDGVTSIDGVETVIGSFDIYNLQGIRVRTAATSLEGLTPGVYVVNGKKVMVK